MKACTKCGVEKPETEYYVRDKAKGKLHAQCKQCYQAHRIITNYALHYAKYRELYLARAKERRNRLRKEFHSNMLRYLSDKACSDCGENDIRVLEFDHIDPSAKSFSVSRAVRLGYSWEDTLIEIKKCRVLCANCHKKRTAQQFSWYKAKMEAPTGFEPV